MPPADPVSVPDPQEETNIKLEGSEMENGNLDSSAAWLLSDDFELMAMTADKDAATLRSECNHLVDESTTRLRLGQAQLAANEYEAPDQRYNRLNKRLEELAKICSTYVDVICGSSSREERSVSIEQLLAEAGREGMRAKALQADVLKPIIREAGGPQALVSQMEMIRPLINKVGGVQELEDLVSEMYLVRIGLNEVGGLQGLHNLIAEVKRLKDEQLDTRARVEGPNGLSEKAAKYDRLAQAFSKIQGQREPVAPAGCVAPTEYVAPAGTATMNPARANLIASIPLEFDPFRDLYEPPPVGEPRNRTGSNNIPLGHPYARERPSRWDSELLSVKQEPMDDIDMGETTKKRPRTEFEHSSAPMQMSRTPSLKEEPPHDSPNQLPEYKTRYKRRMRY